MRHEDDFFFFLAGGSTKDNNLEKLKKMVREDPKQDMYDRENDLHLINRKNN
jgi:hypothetical protein